MPLLEAERSLLLMIDLQERFLPLIHRPQLTIEACRRLLTLADLFSVPVLVTEQYPQGIGPTDASLLELLESHKAPKRRVEKTRFSCCGAKHFETALAELQGQRTASELQIVVAGVEAHVCVAQTVIGLLERDYEVFVCWDAVSGRGEEYRAWALERLQQAGASITNHESVGFEWARHKEDPRFKAVNRLFRQGQLTSDELS